MVFPCLPMILPTSLGATRTSINVEPKAFDGFWMKSAYRIPTGAFPGARFASQENAQTTPITEISSAR